MGTLDQRKYDMFDSTLISLEAEYRALENQYWNLKNQFDEIDGANKKCIEEITKWENKIKELTTKQKQYRSLEAAVENGVDDLVKGEKNINQSANKIKSSDTSAIAQAKIDNLNHYAELAAKIVSTMKSTVLPEIRKKMNEITKNIENIKTKIKKLEEQKKKNEAKLLSLNTGMDNLKQQMADFKYAKWNFNRPK